MLYKICHNPSFKHWPYITIPQHCENISPVVASLYIDITPGQALLYSWRKNLHEPLRACCPFRSDEQSARMEHQFMSPS